MSCQDNAVIATRVATVVVRFDATEVAVLVTTDCMPPMSLVIRDCTSPVRVRVKNARLWRCRWAKTPVRSPCMTSCPMRVEIHVWATPRAAVTAATATMPAASQASSVTSRSGRATSMTSRSRNGEAIPTIEDATIVTTTTVSGPRCGANSAPMRRSETARACSRSSGVAVRVSGRPGRFGGRVSKGSPPRSFTVVASL